MNQKLKYHYLNKKGYLQIDFAFALFIFVILFYFVHSYVVEYETFQNDVYNYNNLDSISNDLCNLLISNSGYPLNWESSIPSIKTIGLKEISSSNLDSNKINVLNNSIYYSILDSLGLNYYNLNIKIIGITSKTNYLNFGIWDDTKSISSVCYTNYNSELVKVIVGVSK